MAATHLMGQKRCRGTPRLPDNLLLLILFLLPLVITAGGFLCSFLRQRRIKFDGVEKLSGQYPPGKTMEQLGEQDYTHWGYIPQDFGFYLDFTAHEFMLYMAAVKGNKRLAKNGRKSCFI